MHTVFLRSPDGQAYAAEVRLSAAEKAVIHSVPAIYTPGGMGPELPPNGTPVPDVVRFGGACHVDTEARLTGCLDQFRAALRAEILARRAREQTASDFRAGRDAFPGGRWMDAARGNKGYPDHPACPFRRADRVSAWELGYESALEEMNLAA